ncbi:MucBP domain-containing protein [Cytobacillus horneckiae]|uniref:Uncharacterized protein n=1 Tax=Cytobacillus horneckiae TaxID=549687 RepID=A0A2N0Z8C4_9BACI|nr:MucBP domain-containing protein [Cytobacillus horneckiae]MEC1158684.1 MucBP domain-containing protein [Cytobacillus horneckiae]NRG44030.1 hypothetical protein [Bacillus sp. CRN 9]PKG25761.1 hypothetical protein CWS20_27545 [Cytobacillus horneckiae]
MSKRVLYLLPFLIILFLFVNSPKTFATHQSIPDANATMNNGFSPFEVDKNSYNKRWNIKGNKANSFTSGSRLAYDVYSGASGNSLKRSWAIQNSNRWTGKSEPYLVFWGWSALVGHHHHGANNQATYILAYNPDTREEKMYKTEMSSLSATKDIEYNRQNSNENSIYNACSSTAKNKVNTDCNMFYRNVGFKAWLPLNELFPANATKNKWHLYIVKNVEGRVVYDELRLPFQFKDLEHSYGKVSLSSGINAQKLTMLNEGVARRDYPRQTGYSGGLYYDQGRVYQKIDQDESAGAAIWYGVNSPHDSGKKRWGSSAYWGFGGDIATLSYQIDKKSCPDGSTVNMNQDCQANVTINHVDSNTGKTLKTDNKKATVGKSYTFSAEDKGVFKDSKNNPYVPAPANQKFTGTTPNNNMTFTFYYKVSLPDPSSIEELKDSTEGRANGEFQWILNKKNEKEYSRIEVNNNSKITGKHYETRNLDYKINAQGVFSVQDNEIQSYYVDDPELLKGKEINYTFSYEFTNHYSNNYTCEEKQGNDCFQWKLKDITPVWEDKYKKKATWTKKLKADHKYNESFQFTTSSQPMLELLVGRKATFNGNESVSISEQQVKETFTIDKLSTSLISQNWKPIEEKIQYQSGLNNKFFIIPEYMYYYPSDLDVNLQSKYSNTSPFAYSSYAIPLKVASLENKSISFKSLDNFFITKNTGFVFSMPSSITAIADIEKEAKKQYEDFTNSMYNDEVLNTYTDGSRYYLNINGNGEQEPKKWYTDNFVIGKLGLSDVTFHVDRQLQFENYLIGSPVDKPIINEQKESTIIDINYPHSVTIDTTQIQDIKEIANDRSDLLHSFRSTDIQEKYNQLKNIIPQLSK